jgi:hypothetical protein
MRLGNSNRKYVFTPALRTELRLAYAMPKSARAAAITALQTKTGWPRHVFLLEAKRMDIVTSHRRPWTSEEDSTLAAALGRLCVNEIAKLLRRTHESVKARAERLEMVLRVQSSGYGIADLAKILGVPRHRIHDWIEKGLIGSPDETPDGDIRVTDEALTHFIRHNPTLIDFRLADQTFLKRVLYMPKKGSFSASSSEGKAQ